MIVINEKREFYLATDSSCYIMKVLDSGHLGNLFYGKKIRPKEDFGSLYRNFSLACGSSTDYSRETGPFSLNYTRLEAPGYGKGDYREPMIELEFPDGSRTCDFRYKSHRNYAGEKKLDGLPYPFSNGDGVETLEITLTESFYKIDLILSYSVFTGRDVICRSSCIVNRSGDPVRINRLMSFNLDFIESDFELLTLDGKWISERHVNSRRLSEGSFFIDSKKGVSSSDHNPFLCLKRSAAGEHSGECYGFSLMYSGNHRGLAEVSPHNFTRVQMGINPFDFSWKLESGEEFQAPAALLTYSDQGLNGMSRNFHALINNNIVSPGWQFRERPVLVNNWEATYFDFDERKLLKLAEEGAKLGIELFVLDDGWFGKRNDDRSSLGDWHEDKKKLPGGLKRLSRKIHSLGLDFGLWVEPEMVNADSDLYRSRPEWAIQQPGRQASEGRNQLLLDLANPEVIDWLFSTLADLFTRADVQYVKWDHNRNYSDLHSPALPPERQAEQAHRCVLGLYSLLDRLKNKFPDILFESCSSGGNRFDPGMLYYMPQVWTSDNTDAVERIDIQYGTTMLYPLSTMGAHVSASPSHQVLRNTPIETRFNVAAFGLLGYELDLTALSNFDRKAVSREIEFYKEHRKLFQFGDFYRLRSPFGHNRPMWMTVSADRREAMLGYYQKLQKPNPGFEELRLAGLDDSILYRVETRPQYFNIRSFGNLVNHVAPIHLKADGIVHTVVSNNYMFDAEVETITASGDELMHAGLRPAHQFTGTGYTEETRLIADFGSRIYILKAEQD